MKLQSDRSCFSDSVKKSENELIVIELKHAVSRSASSSKGIKVAIHQLDVRLFLVTLLEVNLN